VIISAAVPLDHPLRVLATGGQAPGGRRTSWSLLMDPDIWSPLQPSSLAAATAGLEPETCPHAPEQASSHQCTDWPTEPTPLRTPPKNAEIGPPAENESTRKNEAAQPLLDLTGLRSELEPRRPDCNVMWLICPFCDRPRQKLLLTRKGRPMCASCARRLV
jgi:hypothetical protein